MMSITSLQFVVLFLVSVGIYYLIPGRLQWYALIAFSAYFFCVSSRPVTGLYLAASILITTAVSTVMKKNREGRGAKAALIAGILANLGILALLKYSGFFVSNLNAAGRLLGGPQIPMPAFASPLGVSFYTFSIVGYLLDCYWGITEPETNLLKNALFAGYYPLLTSGPIVRHKDLKDQLYAAHRFDWERVTFGLQRIFWGIFKKLVISARAGMIVDTVYSDTEAYPGLYIWVAALLFMVQLYTDFSGCMDIIIGASECYGIILPENFRTPFFSRSVQEYWQRWHITLGLWMKDYLMYPILRSRAFRNMGKSLKKSLGKKAARQIPTYLGMLILWIVIGLWHGGAWKYILGEGMWFFACIVLGQLMEPVFKKWIAALHINTETFSWHLFQSARVYLLVCIGNLFFRLNSFREALKAMRLSVSRFNPWILFDGSLDQLGLSDKNVRVLFAGILVLLVVSALQEKESVRKMIARQNLVFRWILYVGLIWLIVVFGMYGPGYDAASFIYQQF